MNTLANPNLTASRNLVNELQNCIDFDCYDMGEVSKKNRFKTFLKIAERETGVRDVKTLVDYLQGLPSSITLPIYYEEQRNFLYALGFDEVDEIENVGDFFYNEVAKAIFTNA